MMKLKLWLVLCLCLGSASLSLSGVESTNAPERETPKSGKEAARSNPPQEVHIKTRHDVTINGQKLDYTAEAGTILLRDREEEPTASIFYIAYTREGVEDWSKRPVTFAFNGGPGSSSVWLHLGLLGPRRVLLKEDGRALPPPYKLVDNEYSLLDATDLVFIDPVSTGFSRPVRPEQAKQFYSVEHDVRSVAEFIRLYTTRNLRWASPKFIIGESYGTTRAASLTGELRREQRMNINGIMLVSTVLNFETIAFSPGNDLPYVLYLPSYTAAAWYHQKLPPDLQSLSVTQAMARAESFATRQYNEALVQGAGLSAEKRQTVIKELAHYTGLSEDLIDRANLRIPLELFGAELLRQESRVIGRFDARFTGYVRDRLSTRMEYDPTLEAVSSVFASTLNDYVRRELNYRTDLPYEILAKVEPWSWGEEMGFLDVAETLAESLTRNPFLRVHIASGNFDLATPWLAVRYTFDHLQVAPDLMKNITFDRYSAGHMTYLNLPDLKKQKTDLARFIQDAIAQP